MISKLHMGSWTQLINIHWNDYRRVKVLFEQHTEITLSAVVHDYVVRLKLLNCLNKATHSGQVGL